MALLARRNRFYGHFRFAAMVTRIVFVLALMIVQFSLTLGLIATRATLLIQEVAPMCPYMIYINREYAVI